MKIIGKKSSGFTLIEMAVVLTIASLFIGSTLSIAARVSESERTTLTNERMAYIINALEQYVENYNQLPCPASLTALPSTANFGIGAGTGTATCTQDNDDDTATSNENIVAGAVPFGTLGISPEYMLDGWGRRFTYVVDQDLVFTGTTGVDGFANDGDSDTCNTRGDIRILNTAASPISVISRIATANDESLGCCVVACVEGATVDDTAAMVLISHGKNGFGAYRLKSATRVTDSRATNVRTVEDENTHLDNLDTGLGADDFDDTYKIGIFRTQTGSAPTTVEDDQLYDDIIIYKVKWQLKP